MKEYVQSLVRFTLGAVLLSGAACWGDVDIVSDDAAAEGAAGSASMTEANMLEPPPCEQDDSDCEGAALKRCVAIGNGRPNAWLTVQRCASPALCNEAEVKCDPPACAFGDIRCAGAEPERCSEDLREREPLGTCPGAVYCSPDASKCEAEGKQAPCCLDTPCDPGELRCNGGQLERCRPDQSGLDPVALCATQKLCELSLDGCQGAACSCVPPTCEAGATRCTGATLERCNADQTEWERVNDCTTAELCAEAQAQQLPDCPSAECDSAEFRCAGAVLEVCNSGQTGFDTLETCPGGAAFCDSARGVCSTVPCDVGESRCNGAQVERCRDDQSGFDAVAGGQCATPQLCSVDAQGAAGCRPPECAANAFRCANTQLERCNAGQTGFVNAGPACPRADLCSAARQRCDFCVPSRRECTPDLRSSRTCAPDGNSFGPLTFCPLGCIAATGACQTCTPGEYRCQGGSLSRCAPDGVSFTPLNRGADCAGGNQVSCNNNQVQTAPCGALGCNQQRNACNQCSGQQRACADTLSFISCQPNGTFGPATPCGAGLLCAGAGQCSCTPGQPSCSGDSLQVCNDAGNALVAGQRCSGTNGNVLRTCDDGELITNTCTSGTLCSAATGSTCPGCVEGERSCVAGQPEVCEDGQRVPATPCDTGLLCEGAGLCRCVAGELRCLDGELVQCAPNRQGFNPAPACAGAVLRSCEGDLRVDQDCGSAGLCQESAGGVCAECLASDLPSCSEDGASEIRCVAGQLESTPCAELDLCVDGLGCLLGALP